MKNQNRTIMGALDFSLESLKNMKTAMMDVGHPNKELNWAVGGIITTIVSNLIKIAHETILDSGNNEQANANSDLKIIQDKFNQFMDRMINND